MRPAATAESRLARGRSGLRRDLAECRLKRFGKRLRRLLAMVAEVRLFVGVPWRLAATPELHLGLPQFLEEIVVATHAVGQS